MVESEVSAILTPEDAAERHHTGKSERFHFAPSLAAILTNDTRHIGPCGEHPQSFLARLVNETINTRTVDVLLVALRQAIIQPCPRSPPIIAARHRPGRSAVTDTPYGEHRLVVRHQQRRRMPLVHILCPRGDDDVPICLIRNIDHWQLCEASLRKYCENRKACQIYSCNPI